jgi:hypothetical protein
VLETSVTANKSCVLIKRINFTLYPLSDMEGYKGGKLKIVEKNMFMSELHATEWKILDFFLEGKNSSIQNSQY